MLGNKAFQTGVIGLPRFASAAVLSLVVFVAGCAQDKSPRIYSGPIMGTQYRLTLACKSDQSEEALHQGALQAMQAVNQSMSTYLPDSELSLFNQQQVTDWQSASNDLLDVVAVAKTVAEQTDGALDVTVAPLVQLWGFGPAKQQALTPKVPDVAALQAVASRIGYQKIELDLNAKQWRKQQAQLSVDLSAVAKGYAVDKVASGLQGLGCDDFLIDIGGELSAKGLNTKQKPWRLAIEKPQADSAVQQLLEISDMSIASSGDYRNFYWHEGKRVSHTIDPRSLRPIGHTLASVTVLHNSAAMADAYATAFMVMGDSAVAKAEQLNLPVYFIFRVGNLGQKADQADDYQIVTTKWFEKYRVRK